MPVSLNSSCARLSLPLIALSLWLPACDRLGQGEADGSEQVAPKTTASTASGTPETASETAPETRAEGKANEDGASEQGASEASPAQLAAARKELLAALNEGRSLTKAGDYAGGIAKYRRALDIDPADPSVLAELGWAAFKARELDVAYEHTLRGLRFARDDKQRGMMQYNLGRILEERGDEDRAIDAYRYSLELRENATVAARLASLQGSDAPPQQEGLSGLSALASDQANLSAVCSVLTNRVCPEEFGIVIDDDPDACQCEPKLIAGAPDERWGVVVLEAGTGGMERGFFPVVKTAKGWTLFAMAAYEFNPGAFGIWEETQLRYQGVEEVLAGGGSALVLQFERGRVDRDMGVEEEESETTASTVVCAGSGDLARCTKPLTRRYHYERVVETYGETPDPSIEHDGLPIDVRWDISLGMKDGILEVSGEEAAEAEVRTSNSALGGSLMLTNGKYPLAGLMRASSPGGGSGASAERDVGDGDGGAGQDQH